MYPNVFMIPCFAILLSVLLSFCGRKKEKKDTHEFIPNPVIISNRSMSLTWQIAGGALTNVHLGGDKLNPLSWRIPESWVPENNKKGAHFAGQFLCLGRWGSPTKGEIAAGIPHNGEQTRDNWQLEKKQRDADSVLTLVMTCSLPLDQMKVKRSVKLHPVSSGFTVTEEITSTSTIGRLNNVVQHITLGPPFLNSSTIISSNTEKGFNQTDSIPLLEKVHFRWPYGMNEKDTVDLRRSDSKKGYCVSLILPDSAKYGWVTAADTVNGLLIGYVWKKSEYPWLNIWHSTNNGIPDAKGIEFGTCGMGQPYQKLLRQNARFFGYNSLEYLDAGETTSKSYISFLLKIPHGFTGTSNVGYQTNHILLTDERGNVYRIDCLPFP